MVEKSSTSSFWPSFYEPFRHFGARMADWLAPASEASSDDKTYRIAVELPGVDEKDIDITVDDGMVRQRVLVVDPATGATKATVDHAAKLGSITWSPDGSRLALRAGNPRNRVHQTEDARPFVTEVFGDGHGEKGGFAADHGGLVGCRGDDDGAGETRFPKIVFDELADLAPPLADERDHGDIAVIVPRNHREKLRLADA